MRLVADNNFIRNRILVNVRILEAIPGLRTYRDQLHKLEQLCGTCSGKKSQAERDLQNLWSDIRKLLAGLPEHHKATIRDTVSGGNKIRVPYLVGRGVEAKVIQGEI